MSVEQAPTSFRLTHVPVETLALVAEWLTGDCIALLWFSGDKQLHRQFQRGGVRSITIKLRRISRAMIRVPLLAELTCLETLVVSPRNPIKVDYEHAAFDLSLLPRLLTSLTFKIRLSIRSFTKSMTGRVEYADWKEYLPNLKKLDFSEANVPLYKENCPNMPQHLRVFKTSATLEPELLDALPLAEIEELQVSGGMDRATPEESVTLPLTLKSLVWLGVSGDR